MASAAVVPPSDPRSSIRSGPRKRAARTPAPGVQEDPTITPSELIPYATEQPASAKDPKSTMPSDDQDTARCCPSGRCAHPTMVPSRLIARALLPAPPSVPRSVAESPFQRNACQSIPAGAAPTTTPLSFTAATYAGANAESCMAPSQMHICSPPPARTTATLNIGIAENDANTAADVESRSEHAAPLHAPENPANVEPAAADAVNLSAVPGAKMAEHTPGQSMAPGVEKTRPPPPTWTASWTGFWTKVATAAASAPSATVQPLPAHAPSNPVKPQPAAAEAKRLTGVPSGKSAAQIRGQSMPGGSLRTSPDPFNDTCSRCG